MAPTAFTGGSLSFKGDKDKKKKAKKKKSRESKHRAREKDNAKRGEGEVRDVEDDGLTAAERKAHRFSEEQQRRQLEKAAKRSHRERIEDFNEKLGRLTEHNDIPRVSAAGNG
mmetsp:Transcript_6935/g.15884  ORF Transcript_6935/g.15884 Transcript_6935/m.15884 type:complete len:113 (+) Transcript_6935:98-436(+)